MAGVRMLALVLAVAGSALAAGQDGGPAKNLRLPAARRFALENARIRVVSNPERDVFVVSDKVRRKAPPRVGAEVTVAPMVPWSSAVTVNMWNPAAAFEPYIFRHYWIVAEGCESTERSLKHDNASYWGHYQDKFFNGATMRLYRVKERNYLELIHTTRIRAYEVDEDGPRRSNRRATGTLFYETKGPVARPGDL